MSNPKYIYFNTEQTLAESVYKDVVTFSLLAFCIYISQGSTFWTFITGSMFLITMFARVKMALDERSRPFKTKADLLKFVNSLPDDK